MTLRELWIPWLIMSSKPTIMTYSYYDSYSHDKCCRTVHVTLRMNQMLIIQRQLYELYRKSCDEMILSISIVVRSRMIQKGQERFWQDVSNDPVLLTWNRMQIIICPNIDICIRIKLYWWHIKRGTTRSVQVTLISPTRRPHYYCILLYGLVIQSAWWQIEMCYEDDETRINWFLSLLFLH
jgi:hypothetical protein